MRKINPRSIENLVAGKNKSPRQRKQVKLMPETIEAMAKTGSGSISDGIDRLAVQLPVFDKVRIYLKLMADQGDEQAIRLLEALAGQLLDD